MPRFGRETPSKTATCGDVYLALTRDEWAQERLGFIYRKLFEEERPRRGESPDHFLYVRPGVARAEISALSTWINERFGDPIATVPRTTPFGYLSDRYDGWITLFAALMANQDEHLAGDFSRHVAGLGWATPIVTRFKSGTSTTTPSGSVVSDVVDRVRGIFLPRLDVPSTTATTTASSPPPTPTPPTPPTDDVERKRIERLVRQERLRQQIDAEAAASGTAQPHETLTELLQARRDLDEDILRAQELAAEAAESEELTAEERASLARQDAELEQLRFMRDAYKADLAAAKAQEEHFKRYGQHESTRVGSGRLGRLERTQEERTQEERTQEDEAPAVVEEEQSTVSRYRRSKGSSDVF